MDYKSAFEKSRQWQVVIPSSDDSVAPSHERVTQTKFYNEYFTSGHKINDPTWYPDIAIKDKKGKTVGTYKVNRISLPIQKMSVDIILAHLLGNKTYIEDSSVNDNLALNPYKEYWETRNIDTARYEVLKSVLALGDGAVLFYKENGKLKFKVLSLFYGDSYYMEFDKYGNKSKFYRRYILDDIQHCDVFNDETCATYVLIDSEWKLKETSNHGFNGMPVVYGFRGEGAFWSSVQSNIDNLEVMFSRLSEDNRTKFKAIYHLAVSDPQSVETLKAGTLDMVITEEDGTFKMLSGADLSNQFKFEYESQVEFIFNTLGIVFPKHKSSGDMPTGSMKMMFYPTERVVMSLIHEFDSLIDEINEIVLQGFATENTEFKSDVMNGNIRASIRMFTPQDDSSKVDAIAKLKNAGILSTVTAAEESPYSSNNEENRLRKEQDEKIDYNKRLSDNRLSFLDLE